MVSEISVPIEEFVGILQKRLPDREGNYTFFEVGALDGRDMELMLDAFPNAEGHVFEGLLENHEAYLKDNSRFKSYNVAISNETGYQKFFVKNTNGIHGLRNRGDRYGMSSRSVFCMTLDDFCEKHGVGTIDAIKVDTEGCTYEVLIGAKRMLPNIGIMHIETETSELFEGQVLEADVFELLIKSGFKCVLKRSCLIVGSAYQTDSVWFNGDV